MTTELTLREWRFGQTQAERLCAGVLSIEGFSGIDPQHPLGGPDGLKDVMCRRGLTSFVAAAYFPTGIVPFSEVKKKFKGDLKGVQKNGAGGFVFFVNQPLTVGERKTLLELVEWPVNPTELYHLERLRSILDAPMGCGLRLEYLGIAMSHEEQLAYWSSANIDLAAKIDRIEQLQLMTLHQVRENEGDIRRTSAMVMDLWSDPSSTIDGPAVPRSLWRGGPATANLDIPTLLWLHRALLTETGLPPALVGSLRTISVSVAAFDGTSPYSPPPPEVLPQAITRWCEDWREGYVALEALGRDGRLDGITKAYYEFLRIHPFTDGNGRMARAILDQMLRDLLATSLPLSFADSRIEHQLALQRADGGDLGPLRELLELSLS